MRSQRRVVPACAAALLLLAPAVAGADPPPPAPPPPPAATAAETPGSPAPAAPVVPLSESLTGLAKAEYEGGKVLYGDKDYANAIVKFQRAYEISTDPRLLWNIAVCEKNLRRYSKMLATIKRYQKEAGPRLTDDEKARAAEIVTTVAQFVSALTVTVNEEGADVFIDDEKVGTTPLAAPVTVDVGTRNVRVVKAGFKTETVPKPIPGGGALALDVRLEKEIHRGRLLVVAGPEDLILLDGKPVGKGRWEGAVKSGGHQVRVTAQGMAAYQSEAVVQDTQTRRIEVTLNPLPKTDGTKTILWIVGGAVLATGAAVGGAFLFKPSKAAEVEGSIAPGNVQLSFGGRR
jgi:PEGA domain